jgi:hypothetical protein
VAAGEKMRMFYIMLIILIMNVSAALLSTAFKNQTNIGALPYYDNSTMNDFSQKFNGKNIAGSGMMDDSAYKDSASENFNDLTGWGYVDLIKRSLFLHTLLTDTFGVPLSLALLISIPIYLIYIVTIIQIIFRISGVSLI